MTTFSIAFSAAFFLVFSILCLQFDSRKIRSVQSGLPAAWLKYSWLAVVLPFSAIFLGLCLPFFLTPDYALMLFAWSCGFIAMTALLARGVDVLRLN